METEPPGGVRLDSTVWLIIVTVVLDVLIVVLVMCSR